MIFGLPIHCKTEARKEQEDNIIISPVLIYLSFSNSQLGNFQFRLTPRTINISATMVLARKIIEFKTCDGTMLRGWFYPQVEKSACVIMTHGVRTP